MTKESLNVSRIVGVKVRFFLINIIVMIAVNALDTSCYVNQAIALASKRDFNIQQPKRKPTIEERITDLQIAVLEMEKVMDVIKTVRRTLKMTYSEAAEKLREAIYPLSNAKANEAMKCFNNYGSVDDVCPDLHKALQIARDTLASIETARKNEENVPLSKKQIA